jgi:pSer/pThr/pTyr-binding forkhead associated (FHA) protein
MDDAIDRRELLFKALAGLIGGAIGWLPVELATHSHSLTEQQSTANLIFGLISTALAAGIIGGMILAAEGNTVEITPLARRRFLLGFIVCLLLGIPDSYFSDLIFSHFYNAGGWGVGRVGSEAYLVAGRMAGWTLMGLTLGVGVGLAGASLRNAFKGGLGGLIGGLVGGAGFDLIGAFSESGLASRLIGFCVIGFAIGFFIGLVQQLTKSAWLAVEDGRLKGRQFRLEGRTITLGRAEENAVGLFGDSGVQARHAVITHQGESYALKNLAVQAGTLVNGNRVEMIQLHDGDRVKISNYELTFHLRAERGKAGPSPALSTYAGGNSANPEATMGNPAVSGSPQATPATATAYLLDMSGQHFALRSGVATRIGRAVDNDIVLGDASVSRHHASIEYRNGGFVLRDLGSQNGSWIGGQRVSEAALSQGDSVRLGDATLTFHG